jgi:hypothetical protein
MRKRSFLVGLAFLIPSLSPIADARGDDDTPVEATEVAASIDLSSNTDVSVSSGTPESVEGEPRSQGGLWGSYYAIFYGPALKGTSKFQPQPNGEPNPLAPLLAKNYASLGYALDDRHFISGTAYWILTPLYEQSRSAMRDPYLRVGNAKLVNSGPFNWYADLRVHFPVTTESRDSDMLSGLQTFHIWTYDFNRFLTAGLYGSARMNIFGGQGSGHDLELYAGPNLNFAVSRKLSLTLLYEANLVHNFGAPALTFANDGNDLEPGVSWDALPNLNLNPYLNLYPDNLSLRSTSFGMLLNWAIF